MKNINLGATFLFLSILCSIKIEQLLFLKFLQNLAFLTAFFWLFNKTRKKIIAISVISEIMASIWNVFIKFPWHDEKLIICDFKLSFNKKPFLQIELENSSFSSCRAVSGYLKLQRVFQHDHSVIWRYFWELKERSAHAEKHFSDYMWHAKGFSAWPLCVFTRISTFQFRFWFKRRIIMHYSKRMDML